MATDPSASGRPWPFIRTMIATDQVDSTSDRAAELLLRGTAGPLPMCVWSRTQTRGRGRGHHTWWSDRGGRTFTLAFDPEEHGLPWEVGPRLALMTAVAVVEAIEALGFGHPALGIRWPNDVQVGRLKLGGTLPEQVVTDQGRRVLIGVGLNVATDPADMPAVVRGMATSLAAIQGRPLEDETLPLLLAAILDRFGSVLGRLVDRSPELVRRWNDLDLLRDEWVSVDLGPRVIAGWGRGIEPDGSLRLDDGRERHRVVGGLVLR